MYGARIDEAHDFWTEAKELCESVYEPYEQRLAYYMYYGYILSTPRGMIWAEPDLSHQSWLIYLAIGRGCIPMFINALPFWLPNFSFARFLRKQHNIHTLPLERLCRYYGIDPEILKARKIPA